MSFRIGECSSCGANYKLPASFEADQARCKNCGGTVQIGKAGEPGPSKSAPPVPAKQAAATSAPVEVTRKKKKDGPSMKERLLAERQAAAAAAAKPAPAAKPAAKATPKATAKPAAKPAAKSASGGSSRRARPAGARGSSSRRKSSGDDEGEGGSSRRGGGSRRRGGAEKKKAPIGGLIGAVVLVLAVGGGAYWFLTKDDAKVDDVEAADNSGTEVAEGETGSEDSGEETGTEDGAEPELADATSGTEDGGEASEDGGEAATEGDDGAESAAAEPAKKPAKKKGDPASVDLSTIPDYGPIAGCSESRFLELQELAATMVDPEAGAAGNRARNKLVEAGKESFPVIMNALKQLDLTDTDEFRSADVCQKALQDLCNGNNFGWKYPSQEPEDFHYFDKRVIQSWSRAWDQAADNDGAWAKLAKLDKVEKTEDDGAEEDEETEDALDSLDDF